MKKIKWINHALLAAVVFIWAGVGYYVYSAYNGQEYGIKYAGKTERVSSNQVDTVRDYQLSLNYADPFTKKVYAERSSMNIQYSTTNYTAKNASSDNNLNSSKSVQSQNQIILSESLEKIAYSGRIKSGKKTLAIIRLSDIEKMVQVGDVVDIFIVDNITEDSLGLKYNKKNIYVKKSK